MFWSLRVTWNKTVRNVILLGRRLQRRAAAGRGTSDRQASTSGRGSVWRWAQLGAGAERGAYSLIRSCTPLTMQLEEIPNMSMSASDGPERGTFSTFSFLMMMSRSCERAEQTASPRPPVTRA